MTITELREVQVDHLANRRIAHVGGDIARLQFAQQHVNQHAIGGEVFHRHAAEFFVGAVRGWGLKGHHALAALGNLATIAIAVWKVSGKSSSSS